MARVNDPEAERLHLLMEECGEVIQACAKILRHGYESKHPAHPDGPNNRADLQKEVTDVIAAVALMFNADDLRMITDVDVQHTLNRKRNFLRHQSAGLFHITYPPMNLGNAELDGTAPNHFDPSKRGFQP